MPTKKYNMKGGKVELKHRLVLKQVEKNMKAGKGGSVALAMKDLGYSDDYADSAHIKNTNTWKELLESTLPDATLLKVHKEGLKAESTLYATSDGEISDTMTVPDNNSRFKYLDSGYKLKGKYAPTQLEVKRRRSLAEIDEEIAATLGEVAELI